MARGTKGSLITCRHDTAASGEAGDLLSRSINVAKASSLLAVFTPPKQWQARMLTPLLNLDAARRALNFDSELHEC